MLKKLLNRIARTALGTNGDVLRRIRLRRLADKRRRKRGGGSDRVRSGRERMTI